jgi:hypothetical protein
MEAINFSQTLITFYRTTRYYIPDDVDVHNHCCGSPKSNTKNIISNTEVKVKGKAVPMPVTVAERSRACTVFARSEAGIVGSNPTQGMDV